LIQADIGEGRAGRCRDAVAPLVLGNVKGAIGARAEKVCGFFTYRGGGASAGCAWSICDVNSSSATTCATGAGNVGCINNDKTNIFDVDANAIPRIEKAPVNQ